MRVVILFLLGTLGCFGSALASSESSGSSAELFELSFEELLDVNIDLATKTDETRTSVPSSITVFNKRHIALLGVKNAYELMNFVPGFQMTRGDWVGAVPKEHTRGVYLDSGNVLVMINGQRLNESSFGKASVYTPFIPVEIVERVEFIRGPGSALYGSNAFLGVMNVVTKQAANEVVVGIGEHGHQQLSTSLSVKLSGDLSVFANVAWQQQAGEPYFDGQVKDPLLSQFVELGAAFHRWQIEYRQNDVHLNGFINLAGVSPHNQHHSQNRALSVEYQWLKDETWQVSSRLYKVSHEIVSAGLIIPGDVLGGGDFFVGPAWHSSDLNLTTDAVYFHGAATFNFGAEISRAKQDNASIRTSYFNHSSKEVELLPQFYLDDIVTKQDYPQFDALEARFNSEAVYAQMKYQVNDALTVFVGARYDHVADIDAKISPRIALVAALSPEQTLKLQYGESFRSPVSNELYSNDDVTVGNPNLTAESIKTTELVWHWQTKTVQLDAVLFNNDLSDFINLIPIDEVGSRFRFENAFSTSMKGLEANGNVTLTEQSWFEFGYTQLFDEPLNPSFKRFAVAAWKHQLGTLQLSLNANWRDTVMVPGVEVDFTQSAYLLLGGSAIWQFDDRQQVAIKVQNMLDKQYYVFEPRLLDGAMPGAGRQLRLEYTYRL
ncbi:TonB-dependent receptor plug domain-containing protein [Pseudoalteromonas fenneropenaei]|uniref:TonB-dependent receptor plug domain-containing protein n=1 Tax=Pseudoalteromonas fenneropenaei TaxID=1737459 RepID=A0ABV7CQK3_9GAMM